MNEQQILEELLALLEANGVQIRTEPLGGGGGGLCTVKGKNVFFVDSQAGSNDVASLAAGAASGLVSVDNVYIKPQVRKYIEAHCSEQKMTEKPYA